MRCFHASTLATFDFDQALLNKLSAGTLRYIAQATAYNSELCEARITTAIYRVLMLNS